MMLLAGQAQSDARAMRAEVGELNPAMHGVHEAPDHRKAETRPARPARSEWPVGVPEQFGREARSVGDRASDGYGAVMPWKPPTLKAPQRYGWAQGSDRRWRKLRARKLADEPRSERCLAKGSVSMATEVHNRKPISEGGDKYDWNNLESVCGDCQDEAHGAKPKIRFDPRSGLPLPG
jgi:hypothetical protein